MFIYFCWCQYSCLHWLEGQQQGKHEFIFGKERIAHLPSRVSDPMEGTAATHSQANTHQALPKQFIEDLLVEKLDELILQSLSLQLLNLSFSNSSPMVKRQTPQKNNRTTVSLIFKDERPSNVVEDSAQASSAVLMASRKISMNHSKLYWYMGSTLISHEKVWIAFRVSKSSWNKEVC